MTTINHENRRYRLFWRRATAKGTTIAEGEVGRGKWHPMTHKDAITCKSKMPLRDGCHYFLVEVEPKPTWTSVTA